MEEQEVKRKHRTPEERAAELDAKIGALQQSVAKYEGQRAAAVQAFDDKIAAAKAKIGALEQQKKGILTPKPRKPRKTKKQKTEEVIRKALKAGLDLNQIAERLGVDLDVNS